MGLGGNVISRTDERELETWLKCRYNQIDRDNTNQNSK